MKQTAVEQLVQEINRLTGLNIAIDEPCIIKAKEIEKQQIENAFNYAQFDLGMESNEYYNETFKSE